MIESEYLEPLLSLIFIFMVALISPGPDFALIVKNSLRYSRTTAIFTALGIACGALIHSSYILFGMGELIINSPIAIGILKYAGGFYLIYLGYSGIMFKAKNSNGSEDFDQENDISKMAAIFSGLMTCLLNPKAIFFLTSLLSTVSIMKPSPSFLFLCGLVIFIQTFLWYSFVGAFLSSKMIRKKVESIEHWIHRITGCILFVIGLKVLA